MKVAIYTLGCKVNLYESEVIMNSFKKSGYEIVDFEDNADIVIINTCTVTNTSDKKSRNIIRQAVKKHENAVIVVMAWGKVKGMKKGIGQGSEKRAWHVSKNDGQGI